MAEDESEALKHVRVLQSMIDLSAERLEGLRTECSTTERLTQHEIRTLEGKLVKLFSRQMVGRAQLREPHRAPGHGQSCLVQWLKVVGLKEDSINGVCRKVYSLEGLRDKSEHEVRLILNEAGLREEETRRLARALRNLRRYIDILGREERKDGIVEPLDETLCWDSWDRAVHTGPHDSRTSPRPPRSRHQRRSVPSAEDEPACQGLHQGPPAPHLLAGPLSPASLHPTPPATPTAKGKVKFPTTPPPRKKHQTGNQLPHQSAVNTNRTLPNPELPLKKSKSDESQLSNKGEAPTSSDTSAPKGDLRRRGRLPTVGGDGGDVGGHASPLLASPLRSPPYGPSGGSDCSDDIPAGTLGRLQIPKSPKTPTVGRQMGHYINHRFTRTFKMMTQCNACSKQMFGTGVKCKECGFVCHKDCSESIPPACGLPTGLFDAFREKLESGGTFPSPSMSTGRLTGLRKPSKGSKGGGGVGLGGVAPFAGPDSSSNTSSCNSSTPSSPALLGAATPLAKGHFHFPEVVGGVTLETHPLSPPPSGIGIPRIHRGRPAPDLLETQCSNDSDRTIVSSVGDSTDSGLNRLDSQGSQDGADRLAWPRQNSLSLREWDIPYDELSISEPIGTGRFGTVFGGNWHGSVAVKVLNMNYLDDEKTLEAFKSEVGTFRKTRHENLILFMGACMKPPKLALVTSLCKGLTLYTHIHLRKDKFNMNKTTNIAQQITQGMGYLHSRGIVHKDLKSKNIFLENNKVVITDFGLFNVTRLCHGSRKNSGLSIPPGWLCYLSPEIIRSLRGSENEELPFTKASDIYAFGTVWYELLCGDWPFKEQPPEAIIWQVGKGIKQSLANLQASRDTKDILMLCWAFKAAERPDFVQLATTLGKLPKKRLARSPSHPVHLSRSAESVF
ncbi:kinase suppressor of Ras 2 isoform X2 [Neocloeon triangulifer]|uniref:kinase suppressor of Ras 2 isoform X2 n=1 Tax=Neocloeon triangulifer TaxID=2078957 RepID=UPI00286F8597|nr:kinase suppressor of Ras 2 isoform X2 [Neocloeon triangulifer]